MLDHHKRNQFLLILMVGLTPSIGVAQDKQPQSITPPLGADLVHRQEISSNNTSYNVLHYLNRDTLEVTDIYLDESGKQITGIPNTPYTRPRIGPELSEFLSDSNTNTQKIDVDVLLNVPDIEWEEEYSTVSYRYEKGIESLEVGELSAADVDLKDLELRYKSSRDNYRDKKTRIIDDIKARVYRSIDISNEDIVGSAESSAVSKLTLSLELSQIRKLIDDKTNVKWIGISSEPIDGIANAMLETNVDPEALTRPNHTGDGTGIFMTENGCAPNGEVPNYTWLGGGNNTPHAQRVVGIIDQVSPDSWKYCRTVVGGGPILPTNADLDGTGGNPAIHIITRSNGAAGTNYVAADETWDDFAYDNELAIFLLAGNNGNGNGNVWAPGHGLNMITVGSYNDATGNIDGFSSWRDTNQTLNEKPEIVAPGNTIAVPNLPGAGQSGTSFSTPHAAAFAANLMENFNGYRSNPYLLKASMIAGARNIVAGNVDRVGEGGIDYLQHVNGDYVKSWRGNSGTFDWLDTSTDGVDDEWIEHQFWLSAGANSARVAIAWQLRGEFIADNLGSAQPMGANYDFMVFNPNGSYMGGGWQYHNPYDILEFDPNVSGFYKIRIRRTSNDDNSAKFHLGYAVNWE